MSDSGWIFHPNALADADISDLEDWQLLVAACHFGSKMRDCRDLNYGYELRGETIFLAGDHEVDLTADIDTHDTIGALERYADFDWREYAREKIRTYTGEATP